MFLEAKYVPNRNVTRLNCFYWIIMMMPVSYVRQNVVSIYYGKETNDEKEERDSDNNQHTLKPH